MPCAHDTPEVAPQGGRYSPEVALSWRSLYPRGRPLLQEVARPEVARPEVARPKPQTPEVASADCPWRLPPLELSSSL